MFELVNAARHLERRGIRAETANRGFPHSVGRRGEDQRGADVTQQPRGMLKLGFELTRSPPRVSEDQARARRRVRLEKTTQPLRRRRQIKAVADVPAVAWLVFVPDKHPTRLRFDGAADPD